VFAQNKIDPKTFFKLTRGANHETNALAVANKQIDVATNNSENLEKIKDKLPEKFNDIRIIWTSPLIPLDPLVMRKDLPEASKAKIRDFFYSYGKGGQQELDNLFKLNKLSGFKASSNNQLTPIRQLELFKTRNKVESDATLAAADKQVKLADIDKQLAALGQVK
jgi:phosphonate transport system substrate-binding protein